MCVGRQLMWGRKFTNILPLARDVGTISELVSLIVQWTV